MNLRDLSDIDQALRLLSDPCTRIQFSQFGEDVIIESMLSTFRVPRNGGFYVDVGAHHPLYLSNTAMLHQLGWTGVNIDANPESIELFERFRPGDRNVLAAVSDQPGEVDFVVFEASALSSADLQMVDQILSQGRSQVVSQFSLATRRLDDVLGATVPAGRRIDLMNVDVEGFDLRVLRSNDWQRFAPVFLLVEDQALSLLDKPSSDIFQFLTPLGYRLVSKAFITSIYVRDQI